MILVCEECGSKDILSLMWVDVNTNKVLGFGPFETQENWCNKCKKNVDFIDVNNFLNFQKKKKKNKL